MTKTILGVICTALVKYFRVAAKEHLPGGEFCNLTSDQVRGVPTHNKFAERIFGYWKQLMRYMPNVQALTAEAFTLFAMNKTSAWLAAKGVKSIEDHYHCHYELDNSLSFTLYKK